MPGSHCVAPATVGKDKEWSVWGRRRLGNRNTNVVYSRLLAGKVKMDKMCPSPGFLMEDED